MLRPFARLVVAGAFVLLATTAHAQTAVFVASNGNDADDCSRSAPCRTLQRGIDQVPARGEVQILDAGTYGENIIIGKSLTISAIGVPATIGSIEIDSPTARVALRGLHFNGRGLSNTAGVAIASATAVYVMDCEIDGFTGAGDGIVLGGDNVTLVISRTIVRSNGFYGLLINGGSDLGRVLIENSRFENNGGDGIRNVGNGVQVTIESSILSGNASSGLYVGTGTIGRISNSVITNNGTGLTNSGGTLQSRVNNMVIGNGTNTSGSISPLAGV